MCGGGGNPGNGQHRAQCDGVFRRWEKGPDEEPPELEHEGQGRFEVWRQVWEEIPAS